MISRVYKTSGMGGGGGVQGVVVTSIEEVTEESYFFVYFKLLVIEMQGRLSIFLLNDNVNSVTCEKIEIYIIGLEISKKLLRIIHANILSNSCYDLKFEAFQQRKLGLRLDKDDTARDIEI